MSVWKLDRNDVDACQRFWRDVEKTRPLTGEEWRVMLRLQDDPTELRARRAADKKPAEPPLPTDE